MADRSEGQTTVREFGIDWEENPFLWRDGHRPFDPQELVHFEERAGHRLPGFFRDALARIEGRRPTTNTIRIKDEDGETALEMFSILRFSPEEEAQPDGESENAWLGLKCVQRLHAHLVPFASDTCGGLFCFDMTTSQRNPAVVFVDTEDDLRIKPVAKSFRSLARALRDRPGWLARLLGWRRSPQAA